MSIGDTLAEARRQAGLTVTQVSQRTCIRETIIRGIEQGDYSACGGDFYARGHIRSIARAVGVDPEPLIREYDADPRRAPADQGRRRVRAGHADQDQGAALAELERWPWSWRCRDGRLRRLPRGLIVVGGLAGRGRSRRGHHPHKPPAKHPPPPSRPLPRPPARPTMW